MEELNRHYRLHEGSENSCTLRQILGMLGFETLPPRKYQESLVRKLESYGVKRAGRGLWDQASVLSFLEGREARLEDFENLPDEEVLKRLKLKEEQLPGSESAEKVAEVFGYKYWDSLKYVLFAFGVTLSETGVERGSLGKALLKMPIRGETRQGFFDRLNYSLDEIAKLSNGSDNDEPARSEYIPFDFSRTYRIDGLPKLGNGLEPATVRLIEKSLRRYSAIPGIPGITIANILINNVKFIRGYGNDFVSNEPVTRRCITALKSLGYEGESGRMRRTITTQWSAYFQVKTW